LCEGDTVSLSPRAVHDRGDADAARKMRHGCNLRGFLGSTFKPFQELDE
jgi:hypothetical protein